MEKMRKAMREGSSCVVQLLNYKKNGVKPAASHFADAGLESYNHAPRCSCPGR